MILSPMLEEMQFFLEYKHRETVWLLITIISFQKGFEVASETVDKRMNLTAKGVEQKPSLPRTPHLSIALAAQLTSRGTRKEKAWPSMENESENT